MAALLQKIPRLIRAQLKMRLPRESERTVDPPHLDNVNLFAPINLSRLTLDLARPRGLLSSGENFNGKIILECQ